MLPPAASLRGPGQSQRHACAAASMQAPSPSARAGGPPRRPLAVQKSRGTPAGPAAAEPLPGRLPLAGAVALVPLAPPGSGAAQLSAGKQLPRRAHSAAGRRASAPARLPAMSVAAAPQAASGKEALRHQGPNAKDAAKESLLSLTAAGRVWGGRGGKRSGWASAAQAPRASHVARLGGLLGSSHQAGHCRAAPTHLHGLHAVEALGAGLHAAGDSEHDGRSSVAACVVWGRLQGWCRLLGRLSSAGCEPNEVAGGLGRHAHHVVPDCPPLRPTPVPRATHRSCSR